MAIGMKRTYAKRNPTTIRTISTGSGYSRNPRTIGVTRSFALRAPMSTRGWRPFTRVMANAELKVQDLAVATYQVNTSGSITLLAIPVTGADFNARIGRKIKLRSLYIKGRIQLEVDATLAAVSVTGQQARCMIVYDLQPNGAAPSITDILNTADPASHLNLNNRDRFRILVDKEYTFDPYSSVQTATQAQLCFGRTIYNMKLYKKLNLDMVFNAVNGGTVADIASGALYMVWIGSATASTNGDVNAIVSTRVRYSDV